MSPIIWNWIKTTTMDHISELAFFFFIIVQKDRSKGIFEYCLQLLSWKVFLKVLKVLKVKVSIVNDSPFDWIVEYFYDSIVMMPRRIVIVWIKNNSEPSISFEYL